MKVDFIMWAVFIAVISISLCVDLVFINKRTQAPSLKESAKLVCVWVALALGFGGIIFAVFGFEKAVEYLTGYVVEYSLSIDNMFVFLMIFAYFAIPEKYQPKVLMYGILGAVILRFVFVFAGVRLINAFSWTTYVFGAFLIFTGAKMLKGGNEGGIEKSTAFKILKKVLPFCSEIGGGKFFVRQNGVLYATSMFAAVIVVEFSDIIFAVDSIPAVLSITTDPFIVYASNIFAVLGLRALYFMLSGLACKFKFLKYGVAVILFFVGLKMLFAHYVHVGSLLSLAIIIFILALSVIISIRSSD